MTKDRKISRPNVLDTTLKKQIVIKVNNTINAIDSPIFPARNPPMTPVRDPTTRGIDVL
jgi:hypothetical protein